MLLQLATTPVQAQSDAGTVPTTPISSNYTKLNFSEFSCDDLYLLLADAKLEVFGEEVLAAHSGTKFQVESSPLLDEAKAEQSPATIRTDEPEIVWPVEAVGLPLDPKRALIDIPFTNTVTITTTTGLTFTYHTTAPTVLSADAEIDPTIATIQELINSGQLTFGPNRASYDADTNPDCDSEGNYNLHEKHQLELLISGDPDRSYLVNQTNQVDQLPFHIMDVPIIEADNGSSFDQIIEAVLLAGKLKVDMLKLSVGGQLITSEEITHLTTAMEYAATRGVIMVVAGGNIPTNDEPFYPACIEVPNKLLAFASEISYEGIHQLYPHGTMTCATGNEYNMAGPGYRLPVTDENGDEEIISGSSNVPYALIIGLALLHREHPDLSDTELLELFMEKFHNENFPANEYDILGFKIPPEYLQGYIPPDPEVQIFLPLIAH